MATFKVSILERSKTKSSLSEVSTVTADRVSINASAPNKKNIFSFETYGIAFYNDISVFFGSDETLVAFFPGTDWVVEQV
jgi:hypothetical protein